MRGTPLHHSARPACALIVAALLGGCASVRVDDQGSTHIAGLVWLTLPAPPEGAGAPTKAAHVVRARSVGLTLQLGPDGGSLTFGFSDATLATLYNDSTVRLPAGGLAAKAGD